MTSTSTEAEIRHEAQEAQGLMDKSILLKTKFKKWGIRRTVPVTERNGNVDAQVDAGQVVSEADAPMMGASKKLVDCAEYKAIVTHDSRVKKWLQGRCLPSPWKGGVYIIPLGLIADVDARLEELAAEREVLVGTFMDRYEGAVAEARTRLRSLFNESQYPPAAEVRAEFLFRWALESYAASPVKLRDISERLFEREKQKARDEVRNAVDECRAALRVGMQSFVRDLVDRLTPDENGRARLRAPFVERFNDWLNVFEERNLTDDGELADAVRATRALLDGADPKDLRNDADLNATVLEELKRIQPMVDHLVEELPENYRAINFGDGDNNAAAA